MFQPLVQKFLEDSSLCSIISVVSIIQFKLVVVEMEAFQFLFIHFGIYSPRSGLK